MWTRRNIEQQVLCPRASSEPASVRKRQFQAIHSIPINNPPAVKLPNIGLDLVFHSSADRRIKPHIQAAIIYFTYSRKKLLSRFFKDLPRLAINSSPADTLGFRLSPAHD